jgi:hypothetical protein
MARNMENVSLNTVVAPIYSTKSILLASSPPMTKSAILDSGSSSHYLTSNAVQHLPTTPSPAIHIINLDYFLSLPITLILAVIGQKINFAVSPCQNNKG